MTTQGWIFMVGLRVFDIGALIAWLVWFYKLRDDGDDAHGDDDTRGGGSPPARDPQPRGPDGGLPLPLPDADSWPARRRDHTGDRKAQPVPGRRSPRPEPQRVPTMIDSTTRAPDRGLGSAPDRHPHPRK